MYEAANKYLAKHDDKLRQDIKQLESDLENLEKQLDELIPSEGQSETRTQSEARENVRKEIQDKQIEHNTKNRILHIHGICNIRYEVYNIQFTLYQVII